MGSISLREVLDQAEANDVVGRTKMLVILESLPGLGKVKARKLLEQIDIAETRTTRGIGDKQRARLLEAIEHRSAGAEERA